MKKVLVIIALSISVIACDKKSEVKVLAEEIVKEKDKKSQPQNHSNE